MMGIQSGLPDPDPELESYRVYHLLRAGLRIDVDRFLSRAPSGFSDPEPIRNRINSDIEEARAMIATPRRRSADPDLQNPDPHNIDSRRD